MHALRVFSDAEELDFVANYLSLEQLRLGDRLRVTLRIEDCQFEPVDPLKTHCATA